MSEALEKLRTLLREDIRQIIASELQVKLRVHANGYLITEVYLGGEKVHEHHAVMPSSMSLKNPLAGGIPFEQRLKHADQILDELKRQKEQAWLQQKERSISMTSEHPLKPSPATKRGWLSGLLKSSKDT